MPSNPDSDPKRLAFRQAEKQAKQAQRHYLALKEKAQTSDALGWLAAEQRVAELAGYADSTDYDVFVHFTTPVPAREPIGINVRQALSDLAAKLATQRAQLATAIAIKPSQVRLGKPPRVTHQMTSALQ